MEKVSLRSRFTLEELALLSFYVASAYGEKETVDFYEGVVCVPEILRDFHALEVTEACRGDDYFCGIRANTFCIEYGYSESDYECRFVVTGNHKGSRMSVTFPALQALIPEFKTAEEEEKR